MQAAIFIPAMPAPSGHEKFISGDLKSPRNRPATVHALDNLPNTKQQQVLVKDGRSALRGWNDLNPSLQIGVFITERFQVGFFGQRENGVLHRTHVRLGRNIDNIGNEQIHLPQ